LVDIGNTVSLRHLLLAGVHPLPDNIDALELRPAALGDHFLPSEHAAAEPVPPGEIVLAAGDEVLTRRWTWRQSWLTRTLPETTKVFLNLDGLPPTGVDTIHAAMHDVIKLVSALCGGTLLSCAVLDAGCMEMPLSRA
jgi:DNA/RNA-binding domain of Phe-tRNA-synthetase-like protein